MKIELEEALACIIHLMNENDVHEIVTSEPVALYGNDNEYEISIKRVNKD